MVDLSELSRKQYISFWPLFPESDPGTDVAVFKVPLQGLLVTVNQRRKHGAHGNTEFPQILWEGNLTRKGIKSARSVQVDYPKSFAVTHVWQEVFPQRLSMKFNNLYVWHKQVELHITADLVLN